MARMYLGQPNRCVGVVWGHRSDVDSVWDHGVCSGPTFISFWQPRPEIPLSRPVSGCGEKPTTNSDESQKSKHVLTRALRRELQLNKLPTMSRANGAASKCWADNLPTTPGTPLPLVVLSTDHCSSETPVSDSVLGSRLSLFYAFSLTNSNCRVGSGCRLVPGAPGRCPYRCHGSRGGRRARMFVRRVESRQAASTGTAPSPRRRQFRLHSAPAGQRGRARRMRTARHASS